MNKEEQYFKDDDLAFSVWSNKYRLKEETIEEFFLRIANEFARLDNMTKESQELTSIQWDALSEYGKTRFTTLDRAKDFLKLFKDFKYILPGGSVLAGIGSDKPVSLSNCYVIKTEDSISEIFNAARDMSEIYKRRGGVGIDLSVLRPAGATVNNAAKTTSGVLPFMNLYSTTTNTIGQEGRRGALMLSIDINHPDSPQFITAKQDLTRVTGANVSVRLNNDFMKAVENNENYLLRWPCDKSFNELLDESKHNIPFNTLVEVKTERKSCYVKKIRAQELWDSIIHCAWSTAEPGILFWDNIIDKDPASVYEQFKAVSTNPCVSGNTLILTNKGYVPIIERLNRKTIVWNGQEFTETFPTITGYNQKMLKITVSDGSELECNPYHNFFTWEGYERDGKLIKKEAKDLIIGEKLEKYKFPVILGNPYEPMVYKTLCASYEVGFFAGDGTLKNNKPYIQLYGEKKKLMPLFPNAQHISENIEEDRISFEPTLPWYTHAIGFDKLKKFVPSINDSIYVDTIEQRLAWLAGLIDSDGSRNSSEGSISISSTDKDFLMRVKLHVLNTLGVNGHLLDEKEGGLKTIKGQEYNCNKSYRLTISAFEVNELYKLGLRTYRIKIDDIEVNRNAARFIKIVSIEQLKDAEKVYCFTEEKRSRGCFNGIITGQCGEIPLSPYDSCRLIATNLFNLVQHPFTAQAFIDENLAYKVFYEAQIIGDILVDLELEAVAKIISTTSGTEQELWIKIEKIGKLGRRTGVGITALGDMLAALSSDYTNLVVIEELMKLKMKAELDATIDLAIIHGPFPDYNRELEYKFFEKESIVLNDPYNYDMMPGNQFYEDLLSIFPDQVYKMLKWGRRNISWSTIAPTGSISILAGTSSGCEPTFSLYYTRKKKCNPGEKPDSIDQNGIGFKHYNVVHNKFKDWYSITRINDAENLDDLSPEVLDLLIKQSPWHGNLAEDIDPGERVLVQSALQKYTTHSISSTVNVSKDTTKETIARIYYDAYLADLKGITVYRDGCRTGILVKNESQLNEDSAKQRPIELECKVEQFKNEKKDWVAFVGLFNGKPYEVFTGPKDLETFPIPSFVEKGIIIKLKQDDGSSRYDFRYIDSYGYTNTLGGLSRIFDKEYWNYARFVSALLRSGVPIEQIVKIVEGLSFTNRGMNSWKAGIIRTLKIFIENGTEAIGMTCESCGEHHVIYEGGCLICKDCGSSKCG